MRIIKLIKVFVEYLYHSKVRNVWILYAILSLLLRIHMRFKYLLYYHHYDYYYIINIFLTISFEFMLRVCVSHFMNG